MSQMRPNYGTFWGFMTSKAGSALIGVSGQVAGAAIVGSSQVKAAQIGADAQAKQNAYLLQAQKVDAEFGKTALTYIPTILVFGAATVIAVSLIRSQ